MTEELKPVRCGCGGEAVVRHIEKTSNLPKDRWYIGCPKCDICTGLYDTEAEVVEAWNTAMGATDINVPVKIQLTEHVGNYIFGSCPECNAPVIKPDKYCSECGQRLEWE